MAFTPPTGSTVAFQSDPTKLVATVSVVGINFGNSSVVVAPHSVTALQGTNPWQINFPSPSTISYQLAGSVLAVSGSFSGGNSSVQLLGGIATIGSVVGIQGTNPYIVTGSVQGVMSVLGTVPVTQTTTPWVINMPSPSVIIMQQAGSVLAVSATVNTGNSSVQILNSSIVTTQNYGYGSVMLMTSTNASVAVLATQNTSPWIVNVPTPSYISYQLAGSIMAVAATVNTGNSSVQLLGGVAAIGSVAVLQGTNPWQVNIPTPSYIAYQLAGSVMAVNATVNTGNSSVQLLGGVAVIGSVATLQGTNPWVVNVPTPSYLSIQPAGSVLNANISGSVAAVINNSSVLSFQGTIPWVIQSIVGTYAEDVASTGADKGLFTLGIRNDNVTSLVNADLDYTGWATDSAGRQLTKPFVSEDGSLINFTGSVTSTSVTLIAASVIGKRSYITDFWMANSGSVATIVQFRENTTSVIGVTMAPGGGGSNSPGIAVPIKTFGQNQDLSFTGLTATSILYVTIKGYQAP